MDVLVTASLLSVILTAILALGDGTWRVASRDQERAHVIRDAQVGLHRMTGELRHAYNVVSWSSTSMQADVLTASGNVRVTYDCADPHPIEQGATRCVRTAGGTTDVIVPKVTAATFTYEPNPVPPGSQPRYARVKLEVPAAGDVQDGHAHTIVLDDGLYMRNRDVQ
jgi:hypothetical protein